MDFNKCGYKNFCIHALGVIQHIYTGWMKRTGTLFAVAIPQIKLKKASLFFLFLQNILWDFPMINYSVTFYMLMRTAKLMTNGKKTSRIAFHLKVHFEPSRRSISNGNQWGKHDYGKEIRPIDFWQWPNNLQHHQEENYSK